MSNAPRRNTPLSIRLSDAERAILTERAGNQPLGTYIKAVILGDAPVRPSRKSYSVKDSQALGQVLGMLGKSHIANNLNQLAKAANLGALPVLKETEEDIQVACAHVREMRLLLLAALGQKIMEQVSTAPTISELFAAKAEPGE